MRDRFGQADQLHIDIWWKGYNVAQDGGSYLYNDEMQYHRYFVGTRSHNTINIDNLDQMILLRRFKWMGRVKAKLIYTEEDENNLDGIVGEQYGYCRLPGKIAHRRGLWSLSNGIYIVVDKIIQRQNIPHKIVLQWLLSSWGINLKTKNNWQEIIQNIPCGKYSLYLNSFIDNLNILKDSDLNIVKGRKGENPRGWVSRYYGERNAVNSVELSCVTENPLFFISIFTPSEFDINFAVKKSELTIYFDNQLWKINLDKYFS
jgi:asparagine synthase (glutamine-hydrolysing)